MVITIYDPTNGEIKAVRSASTIEDLQPHIEGKHYIPGSYSLEFYRVDVTTREVVLK